MSQDPNPPAPTVQDGPQVRAAGSTSTGLRFPGSDQPVSAGADNIRALADDVTAHYVAGSTYGQLQGKLAGPLRIVAGVAYVTLNALGQATLRPTYASNPTGVACCFIDPFVAADNPPRDVTGTAGGSGTVGTFWVGVYQGGQIVKNGPYAVQYLVVYT